jgi:hypothetical protein
MAITIKGDGDSGHWLGMSGILQWVGASFSVSDYPPGGYPIFPSQFGLSHIRGLLPMGYTAAGAGFPGGYVWEYIKPAVAGPAASNPGFLVALEQSGVTGSLVPVTGSNANFAGGSLDLLAYGW